MSYFSEIKIVDPVTGDAAEVNDSGQLKVVLDGKIDTNNSTSTPLGIGGVFTGTATEVLDYAIASIVVYTDQTSAADGLSIQQSSDGTNWDLTDEFTIPASKGKVFSVQTACKYLRVVYTNGAVAQTEFRLCVTLKKTNTKASSHRIADAIIDDDDAELVKAVLTGENPAGTFVNFQSTTAGNFKVSLEELENNISSNSNSQLNVTLFDSSGSEITSSDDSDSKTRLDTDSCIVGWQNTDRHTWVTAGNALTTVPFIRLVGTNFDGTTKDTNFWTETVTGSGTVTQGGGEIELSTGTTANSTTQYDSVRTARFVVTSPLQFQAIVKFETAGATDNVRRCGAYKDTDGFYFELDGTTFSIGYRKASADTLVSSGSFNGNYGTTYTMDTNYHKLAIEWGPKGVFFYIDNVLLHKDGQGHRSNFLSLPIRFENDNSNGKDDDMVLDVLASAIGRYGELITSSTYKYIGAAATTVCKYGPGRLHVVVNNDNAGACVIYDNTAGSGNVIASIDLSKVLGSMAFGCPFSTGLTVVTTGATVKITVVYE